MRPVGGEGAPTVQAAEEMMSAMARSPGPRLADVAEVAAFLASDRAAGMTGAMTNASSGLVLR